MAHERQVRAAGTDRRLYILIAVLMISVLLTGYQTALALWDNRAYDLIVVGGEPGGVAAAVSGARMGLRVLLLEGSDALGGTLTRARLNTFDMNYDSRGQILTRGIFLEIFKLLRGDSFDTEEAAYTFLDLVRREKRISLHLNANIVGPVVEGSTVAGVAVNENGVTRIYRGRFIIDATGDADLAALAGVPFTVGAEDNGLGRRTMAATMIFQMGGINWKDLARNLWQKGGEAAGANRTSAWGFGTHAKRYEPGDPFVRMRGLNLGRQRDDTVLVNSLLLFEVDPLSPDSRRMTVLKAQREVANLIPFIRDLSPALRRAYVLSFSPALYIRESRHMKGLYRLTIDDVLENRNFPDRIARGSYPADLQPLTWDGVGIVLGKPANYSIPLRSLLPPNIVNLMVVGRSASYTSLAFTSARTIPVEIVVGESAGIAAAVAKLNKVSLHQLAATPALCEKIQSYLRFRGHTIDDGTAYKAYNPKDEIYVKAKFLRSIAVYAVGYENSMGLDIPLGEQFLAKLLHYFTQRVCYENALKIFTIPAHDGKGSGVLSQENALRMMTQNWNSLCDHLKLPGSAVPESMSWEEAARRDFVPQRLKSGGVFRSALTRGEACLILYHQYRNLRLLTHRPTDDIEAAEAMLK